MSDDAWEGTVTKKSRAHWPASTVQPFAGFINTTQTLVFSSAAPSLGWAQTTHVTEPVVPFAAGLEQRPGRDIGMHGSATVVSATLREPSADHTRPWRRVMP